MFSAVLEKPVFGGRTTAFWATKSIRLILIDISNENAGALARGMDRRNMPKNNIIVLTSLPSGAYNARRLEKHLMNGPKGRGDTP